MSRIKNEFEENKTLIGNKIKDDKQKKALSAFTALNFYDGLKAKEAAELKIGDVWQEGKVKNKVSIPGQKNPIELSPETKAEIRNYISYMQAVQPSFEPSSFLFPYREQSGQKMLQRLIKKHGLAKIDTLRREGARYFYEKMRKKGLDHYGSIKETTEKFRLIKRTVENILKNRTNPPGKKYRKESDKSGKMLKGIEYCRIYAHEGDLIPFIYNNIIGEKIIPDFLDEYREWILKEQEESLKEKDELDQTEEEIYESIYKASNIVLDLCIENFYRYMKNKNSPSPEQLQNLDRAIEAICKSLDFENNYIKSLFEYPGKIQELEENLWKLKIKEEEKELEMFRKNFEDPNNSHSFDEKYEYKRKKVIECFEKLLKELNEKEKKEIRKILKNREKKKEKERERIKKKKEKNEEEDWGEEDTDKYEDGEYETENYEVEEDIEFSY